METNLGTETDLAPLVLFVYQRPQHTKKVLAAIANDPLAKKTVLYVYSDGPKPSATVTEQENIAETRKLVENFKGCKEAHLYFKTQNEGLAKSIINGVSEVVKKHGKVIVLEDDIVISPLFLTYMNEALGIYERDEQVMHISSFVPQRKGIEKLPETYFLRFMSCWGWATWERAWKQNITDSQALYKKLKNNSLIKKFNIDNTSGMSTILMQNIQKRIDTWDINWYASIFIKNGLCLYPKQSLCAQIGLDGSGVHCGLDDLNLYHVTFPSNIKVQRIELSENAYAFNYLKKFNVYGNLYGLSAARHYLRSIKAKILKSL
ncbi:hypothetical protein [Nubsella zeaxanthinifaciens]|uniref:hypothetical protein n=1 Tax=Nubsella zeaxanthinifaciens TaxID=392412 RepID=UPI000DE5613B|nr:hypothetical protein [Nubsella zeaxanthinifaciens]